MQKIYDHLISIGMNCEIRYQLKQKYGAIGSSLLEWAVVPPHHLVEVLKNPNLIFSGDIEEKREHNMWLCKVTDIIFHGKKTIHELLDENGNPDKIKIDQEKQETISRIQYLIDKFIKIARSGDTKLYILGIHPDFCKYKNEELKIFIQRISDAIQEIAINASLLVITIEENSNSIIELDDNSTLFIRTISHFAPYNQAINPKYVDLQRGEELLSEFKLKTVKEETKIYKFEKEIYSPRKETLDIEKEIVPSFKKNSIPVIFSSDNNYAPYLAVAIKSLICNTSSNVNYDIFIIDEHIDENKKKLINCLVSEDMENIKITFVNIIPYIKDIKKSIFCCHGYFSISTYYRFFIPNILKNFDKAIYLDCDIVILYDIAKLYDIDLNSHILGAVKDTEIIRSIQKKSTYCQEKISYFTQKLGMKNPNNYFQAGVLLLNLAKMRQENFESKCIEKLIEVNTPEFVDQDIINSLYENKIYFLPMNWNVEWQLPIQHQNLMDILPVNLYANYINSYNNPFIIHFCSGYKPWKFPDLPLANYFWEYAKLTPFYEEILFKNISRPENNLYNKHSYKLNMLKIKKIWYSILTAISWGKFHEKNKNKNEKYKKQIRDYKS